MHASLYRPPKVTRDEGEGRSTTTLRSSVCMPVLQGPLVQGEKRVDTELLMLLKIKMHLLTPGSSAGGGDCIYMRSF